MKLRKILLLSLGMALCAAGGVGTALAAITRSGASKTSNVVYDQAIYLYWDSNSASKSIDDIAAVSNNVAQYRHLVVSPKSSATVAGNVTVSFTLSTATTTDGKTPVLNGLTVYVYEIASLASETTSAYEAAISAGTLKCTLVKATGDNHANEGSASFAIDGATGAAHETVKHYAIKVLWVDDSSIQESEKLSANLTITQDFGA